MISDRSHNVFNCIAQVHKDLIRIILSLLCVDTNKLFAVLVLHDPKEIAIVLQAALNYRMRVFFLVDEPVNCVLWHFVRYEIVPLAFNWIKTSLFNFLID